MKGICNGIVTVSIDSKSESPQACEESLQNDLQSVCDNGFVCKITNEGGSMCGSESKESWKHIGMVSIDSQSQDPDIKSGSGPIGTAYMLCLHDNENVSKIV